MPKRLSFREAGNAGMVTTTGGGVYDLLHTIPLTTLQNQTFPARTFCIRKVMWYNNTGANVTLQLGTVSATPAFVQLLPDIYALNGFDGELGEADLPFVEFCAVAAAAAAAVRYDGNAYVLDSGAAGGVLVSIEVETFGA